MVDSKASTSDYWYYTGLILAQFKGLQLGYAMAAPPHQVRLNKYKNHLIKNEESSRDGGAKSIEIRVVVLVE